MEEKDTELRDEGLRGNEKIEEAIAGLQQEPTQEMLAHALTVVRRRMKENGQLIVAVDPPAGGGQLLMQTVKTSDGKLWWAAFTGFEEELRGSDRVKSTFLADMGQLFATALQADGVEGIILNPWNRTLMLEKELIRIILGRQGESTCAKRQTWEENAGLVDAAAGITKDKSLDMRQKERKRNDYRCSSCMCEMQTGGAGKGSEVLWGASWTSACQKLGRAEGGRADVRRRDEPD